MKKQVEEEKYLDFLMTFANKSLGASKVKKQVDYFIEEDDLSFLMNLKNKSSSLNKINKKNKNKKEILFYKKRYKNE